MNQLIHLVGLTGFADAFPKELSGGMKKRVDLARAYATDPTVLLMDEPFGALDAITKEKMQVDLMRLSVTDTGQRRTIIFVTHDLEEAIFLADRVAVMTPRPGTIEVVLDVPFPQTARSVDTSIHGIPGSARTNTRTAGHRGGRELT